MAFWVSFRAAFHSFGRSYPAPPGASRDPVTLLTTAVSLLLALSLAIWIVQPVPQGHSYELAPELYGLLLLVAALRATWHRWGERRALSVAVFLAGLIYGALSFSLEDREIIHVYETLFDAIAAHKNPYVDAVIYHLDAHRHVVFGTFNYPPAEILPFYVVRLLAGHQSPLLFVAVQVTLQLIACAIFWSTFRRVARLHVWAILPWLAFMVMDTNSGLTLIVVALLVRTLVHADEHGTSEQLGMRTRMWLLFAFGLLAKFFVIPLYMTHYWRRLWIAPPHRRKSVLIDAALPLVLAWLAVLPFGARHVFDSTVLFNLNLGHREVFTTYYPNTLSALCYWLQVPRLFGPLAVVSLGVAVYCTRWLRELDALLAISIAFLALTTTPEPQFVPAVLCIAAAARLRGLPRSISSTPGSMELLLDAPGRLRRALSRR